MPHLACKWSALSRKIAATVSCVLAVGLSACGTLPSNVGSTDSRALPPNPDSPLVRTALASTPTKDESGVRLMPLGSFSLQTRLELARRATTSLDLQYYIFEGDASGLLLMAALRDAALRGVRVRLLVDDLYTTHSDPLLRDLASFPNVEVRVFNPFCCARTSGVAGRLAASMFDFGRLNHRMHNKLFIADGVMAVAGGRNIADEYFLRAADSNFVDMDAFVIGAVVKDFSTIFDRYWNSPVVYPIDLIDQAHRDRAARREDFDAALAGLPLLGAIHVPSSDLLGYGPLGEELDSGRIGLQWGKARAFADPPEKLLLMTPKIAYEMSVTSGVLMQLWEARRELVLVSPYLIPGETGVAGFRQLGRDGVKVTVVTNSLAATDEPLVHAGYTRYRLAMLDAGVDLYELSSTLSRRSDRLGMFGMSLGRLHEKSAVVDQHLVFIGSMNLDPRSASTNTELGMFIESPALAKEMLRIIRVTKLEGAYRVRRDPTTRQLQWLSSDGEKEVILEAEPEASWWLRTWSSLLGWLTPSALL